MATGQRRGRAGALPAATAVPSTLPPPVEPLAIEPAEPVEAEADTIAAGPEAAPAAADASRKDVDDMATVTETMTEKAEGAAAAGADRARAMFGDAGERAKTAFDKATKLFDEMLDFARGNVEAVVASSRVAAKGAESFAHEASDYGRKNLEKAQGLAKSYAAVRTPADLLHLQSELARAHFDAAVSDASRLSETYVKLMTDIAEPISSRFSVAQDKLKTIAL